MSWEVAAPNAALWGRKGTAILPFEHRRGQRSWLFWRGPIRDALKEREAFASQLLRFDETAPSPQTQDSWLMKMMKFGGQVGGDDLG